MDVTIRAFTGREPKNLSSVEGPDRRLVSDCKRHIGECERQSLQKTRGIDGVGLSCN
jgi:hypothetical protein